MALFFGGLNFWKAFKFYISDFLPYYITEQTLLGSTVEFGDKRHLQATTHGNFPSLILKNSSD
ncbi:hypothetical protein [Aeromonas salmonicida]|uniref:hypothetical protein n=1 Tax=Aeromonas salmonicida TaxID=645 RepID=UPI00216151ED|nr:hypothetical protein [Aeromonas salmonicida]